MAKEIKHCSECGAKMVEYTHRINKGLCNALLKLYQKGGTSSIDKLDLTKSEYCNFQKLKYWELIKKVVPKESEEQEKGGQWTITQIGRQFVEGAEIPMRVTTYRGEPVRYPSDDNDDEYTTMGDCIGSYEYKAYYIETAINQGDESQHDLFSGLE